MVIQKIIGDYFTGQGSRRDQVVIGTKVLWQPASGDPNGGGAGRKSMIDQLDASLRRLKTDYVDIYWLHNWDRFAPIEGQLAQTLDDFVGSGEVRYMASRILPCMENRRGLPSCRIFVAGRRSLPFSSNIRCFERTIEGEHVPMAEAMDMAVMRSLRRTALSGRYRRSAAAPTDAARAVITSAPSQSDYDVVGVLHPELQEELGASPAAVALAWLRTRPQSVPCCSVPAARTTRRKSCSLGRNAHR